VINLLVTGRRGQVGCAVADELTGRVKLIGYERGSLDLADPDAIRQRIRHARPDVIVNAGAYTAVDQAESDEAAAHAVNCRPGVLGEEAKRQCALIHFSTDYVFDGSKRTPYVEDDAVNPVSAYGRTKLRERAVAASGCRYLTLRTSWVYGRGKTSCSRCCAWPKRATSCAWSTTSAAPDFEPRAARAWCVRPRSRGGRRACACAGRPPRRGKRPLSRHGGGRDHGFGRAGDLRSASKRSASLRFRAWCRSRLVSIRRGEAACLFGASNARLAAKLGAAIPDWREGLEDTTAVLFSGR
jgi:dTDP-4-dehydrorhamnose reductase